MDNFNLALQDDVLQTKSIRTLNASMDESMLARRAGATPKIIPTAEETPKASIIDFKVTTAGKTLI